MVRFGQRQTRGFLLGLSGLRVVALGIAAACFLFCLVTGGALGCAIAAPFWGLFAGVALLRFNGRPMIESLPVVADWCARSASGQTRYLVRPSVPRPAGTMALPGDAASLRCYVDPESEAAMVHDPHRNTISAVVSVTHPAYVLLAPDDRAARVSGWSRALATLAASGTVAAVQVLESTVPDPGDAMRSWWEAFGIHDVSWPARQYDELMEGRVGSSVHESLLALSIDLRRAAREVRESGRGMAGSAAVLRSAMAGFGSSLRAAGLHLSGWLDPDELAA
ncbi:MAG TPA: SCO6880 family protein, partial [Acidimicrobiales bacterium]|nr:SCO6880 family protein [Acidimicrobiales bacterium]